MKATLGKWSLGISVVLQLLGWLSLCYCPGWFAIAAVIAGFAALATVSVLRILAVGLVCIALVSAAAHYQAKKRLDDAIERTTPRLASRMAEAKEYGSRADCTNQENRILFRLVPGSARSHDS